MSPPMDASAGADAWAAESDSSSGIDFAVQAPTPEPLFPADVIEESLQEYIRNYKFPEPDSTPPKRYSRHRVRLGPSAIQFVSESGVSGRWSAATTDSEYISESALFTDGGIGNRYRAFTVRVYDGESSSPDEVGSSGSGDDMNKEEYDGDSSEGVLSDDAQLVNEGWGNGHRDRDSIKQEISLRVVGDALPDNEQSASDDGYHVDYDDDENEDPNTPADFFSDVEKGLGECTMDTAFYTAHQSSDEYDTDYNNEPQASRCDSPNIDEINQRINEYLWSTM